MLRYTSSGMPAATPEQAALLAQTLSSLQTKINASEYGFVKMVQTDDYIQTVERVMQACEWATHLVVIGIGGSDLGGRAIKQALQHTSAGIQLHFYGDTTDPHSLDQLLSNIDLGTTVFNFISKSGKTVETMAWYLYIKSIIKARATSSWHKHFVFTTDPTEGLLNAEIRSQTEEIDKLIIPEDVGGRFSVLSPVGLLPAMVLNLDTRQILAGAKAVVDQFRAAALDIDNPPVALRLAHEQFLLHENNTKVMVLWPYSQRLGEFARWWRQLLSESLGKQGKGILPVVSVGPEDQHSQLQLYNDGPALAAHLFLRVEDHGIRHVLKNVDIEEFRYLEGKEFGEIINAEQRATAESLANHGRPVATLEIDQLNPYTLGELFMTFELVVVALGEMLQINAFDQPGVEESKQLIREILQRN